MDLGQSGASARVSLLDRTRSWQILAFMAGLIGLTFVLGWAFPGTFWHPTQPLEIGDDRCRDPALNWMGLYKDYSRDGFFYDYYWMPIVCDEGYNLINTATWALLMLLMVLWAFRLTNELHERVELGLILAVVPYLVWGSVYRVLEDSDLFAPYGAPPGPSGDGFLDHYLGIFFITPIIYVEITFIAVLLLVWAHAARNVANRKGLDQGLRYFGLSLLVLAAFYTALWASEPTYIRYVAHPLVFLVAAAFTLGVVWKVSTSFGRFDAHVGMAGFGLLFLLLGAFYVVKWMTGGTLDWHPDPAEAAALAYPVGMPNPIRDWPVQWWVLPLAVVLPLALAYGVRRLAWTLARPRPPAEGAAVPPAQGATWTVIGLGVGVALALFVTIVGVRDLAQRQIAGAWAAEPVLLLKSLALVAIGPAAMMGAFAWARRLAEHGFGHPAALVFASPINLLIVIGQSLDAYMTSLGIDLFNYSEKHVLPGFLIALVGKLPLPGFLDHYPAAIVMVPLKVFVALVVALAIDGARKDFHGRENLIGLVKLAIIMVGLSPGARDAVRLAMAT